MAFVLDSLPHTAMRDVIVVALTAERIPAALETTLKTNRSSAVGALRDGGLAAQHPDITVAGDVFNSEVHRAPSNSSNS
jgi:hypothetical protein